MRRLSFLLLVLLVTACSKQDLEVENEKLRSLVDDVVDFKSESEVIVRLAKVPKLSPFTFKKSQQHEIHPSVKKLLSEKWKLTGVVSISRPKTCYLRDSHDEVTYVYLGEVFSAGLWQVSKLSVKGAVFKQNKTGEEKLLRFLSEN